MKFFASAAVVAAFALAATPASALERPVTPTAGDNPGSTHQPAAPQTTDGESRPAGAGESRPAADTNPGTARALAAPGRYCKDASKKRVEGEKGTAFAACVKGQAQVRRGKTDSPREACKGASKKRVKGEKGTAFSTCVKAAAKFLKDQEAQEEQEQTQGESTETEVQS